MSNIYNNKILSKKIKYTKNKAENRITKNEWYLDSFDQAATLC